MQIFIVIGSTGEYSDRQEWLVKAFKSEDQAKKFCEALLVLLLKASQKWLNSPLMHKDKLISHMKPLDPNFKIDYTGTYYHIQECELEE